MEAGGAGNNSNDEGNDEVVGSGWTEWDGAVPMIFTAGMLILAVAGAFAGAAPPNSEKLDRRDRSSRVWGSVPGGEKPAKAPIRADVTEPVCSISC